MKPRGQPGGEGRGLASTQRCSLENTAGFVAACTAARALSSLWWLQSFTHYRQSPWPSPQARRTPAASCLEDSLPWSQPGAWHCCCTGGCGKGGGTAGHRAERRRGGRDLIQVVCLPSPGRDNWGKQLRGGKIYSEVSVHGRCTLALGLR